MHPFLLWIPLVPRKGVGRLRGMLMNGCWLGYDNDPGITLCTRWYLIGANCADMGPYRGCLALPPDSRHVIRDHRSQYAPETKLATIPFWRVIITNAPSLFRACRRMCWNLCGRNDSNDTSIRRKVSRKRSGGNACVRLGQFHTHAKPVRANVLGEVDAGCLCR